NRTSWTCGNDGPATPKKPRSPPPPESRSPETDAAASRSLQRTSRAETQIVQRLHPFHTLAHRGELPRRKVFDLRVRAYRQHLRGVARHSAFHVRRVLERGVEQLLLLRAVRTPVCSVHLDALLREALRELVILVRPPVIAEVVSRPQRHEPQRHLNHFAQTRRIPLRLFLDLGLRPLLFALLGHKSSYTTTRRAEGSTSSVSRCKVRASPSTITSTGPSSANSMRRTLCLSAMGCFTCVPSYNVERLRISPMRPIGPQRTYSISPSSTRASGAISIVPPVNLLLLKLRNKHRRRSISPAPSTRSGNGRRASCASRRKIERKYPGSPQPPKLRERGMLTSAANPTLNRLM